MEDNIKNATSELTEDEKILIDLLDEEKKEQRETENQRRLNQSVHETPQISMWERIKKAIKDFFRNVNLNIQTFFLPKKVKDSLHSQMTIELERKQMLEREREKQQENLIPEKLYAKYIALNCEERGNDVEQRLLDLGTDIINIGKNIEIPLPNGQILSLLPETNEKVGTVQFRILDKDRILEAADFIDFKKNGKIWEAVEYQFEAVIELLENKKTFEYNKNKTQNKNNEKETQENKKEEVKNKKEEVNLLTEPKEKYHDLCQAFYENPYLLTFEQLEEMTSLVAKYNLDENQKSAKAIYVKAMDKNGPDMCISSYFSKKTQDIITTYKIGAQQLTKEEAIEKWKASRNITYRMTEEEQQKCKERETSIFPKYQMHPDRLAKSIADAVAANIKDGIEYPEIIKNEIAQIVDNRETKIMTELYSVLSACALENTDEQFHRSYMIQKNIEKTPQGERIADKESLAALLTEYQYVVGISDFIDAYELNNVESANFISDQKKEFVERFEKFYNSDFGKNDINKASEILGFDLFEDITEMAEQIGVKINMIQQEYSQEPEPVIITQNTETMEQKIENMSRQIDEENRVYYVPEYLEGQETIVMEYKEPEL